MSISAISPGCRGPSRRWLTSSEPPVIYQHPLAYLLGLEGVALLRAFSGAYDREFTLARFDEIRELLESPDVFGTGVEARPISTREGYDSWAPSYDEQPNQLLEIEQPIVREILDGLPIGVALDAACGTGRHAAYLASLGHTVIGVDSSPGMLARAARRSRQGEFHEADLHQLPLDRRLCRPRRLRDRARALGGHRGPVPRVRAGAAPRRAPRGVQPEWPHRRPHPPGPDRGPRGRARIPTRVRAPRERLSRGGPPARIPGAQVRGAARPVADSGRGGPVDPRRRAAAAQDPDDPPSIWALHAEAIDATNAAWRGKLSSIIWHFQLAR